ncbi:phosphotransferase enzyme family domain protein [Fusarium beomiforme]|uniref:Phosphotransferase enzyme family domain protein n=1 Tax=Fusarium beomiforme TaxID=44412 RepID=A0A9P5E1E8_9HYPO|nr:phosphotransferase enzyme family domain protein [Fusarium beomiforme]
MATPTASAPHDATRNDTQPPKPFRKEARSFRLLREAEAMKFVQAHTSIPVPEILETNFDPEDKETSWILMERLSGQQLDKAWPIMTETTKARTISELKEYLSQLHRIHRLALAGSVLVLEVQHTTIDCTV